MTPVFLYGTLRHLPLLRIVAGETPVVRPARVIDLATMQAASGDHPVPVPEEGTLAEGLIAELSDAAFARIDWYERAYRYAAEPRDVVTSDGAGRALVWMPPDDERARTAARWSLAAWVTQWSALACLAAEEAMTQYGLIPPETLAARLPMMRARADACLRGARMGTPRIGSAMTSDAVELLDRRADHQGYFVTRTDRIRHPLFGGGTSADLTREVFVAADAAIVLPYDPASDRVLLVEQFRMGPYARGARYPWVLEPVAGRLDPGESAEVCARREAREEAGVEIGTLHYVSGHYPSPGCSSEYFHTFVGICPLSDVAEGRGGLADEHEDIRTHILSFDAAMGLISSGEADNGPLVLLLMWLAGERSRLRGPD